VFPSAPYAYRPSSRNVLSDDGGDATTKNTTPLPRAFNSCGSCCYTIESASSYNDKLDLSFYAKVINIDNFLVTCSSSTSDAALYQAALTFDKMTKDRPDLISTLVAEGVHLTVIGKDEVTTDVPEYEALGSSWDWTRGMGATMSYPVTSCAEENLLCLNDDPYSDENICVHETAHTLQGSGGKLPTTRYVENDDSSDDDLDQAIQNAYGTSVTNNGLWSNTYAGTNHEEYWAEAVQSYYNVNAEGPNSGDGVHNSISTRSELQSYDSEIYNIIAKVFPSDETSAECPPTTCNCNTFKCPSDDNGNNDDTDDNNGGCQDSPLRFKITKEDGRKIMRDCAWVSVKAGNRCTFDGVASACSNSCGTCDDCDDSALRFKITKNDGRKIMRDCAWVSVKAGWRCTFDGVSQACRAACGTCLVSSIFTTV